MLGETRRNDEDVIVARRRQAQQMYGTRCTDDRLQQEVIVGLIPASLDYGYICIRCLRYLVQGVRLVV